MPLSKMPVRHTRRQRTRSAPFRRQSALHNQAAMAVTFIVQVSPLLQPEEEPCIQMLDVRYVA
jgi:hypothetical protein